MVWTRLAFGLKPLTKLTKNRAAAELLFAGFIWGFGFVATIMALEVFTPVETMVYRFIIAAGIGELISLVMGGPSLCPAREDFFRALPAGLLLGSMLLLQTMGLKLTTATNGGFITSLYVIIVPFLNVLLFKARSAWFTYLFAVLALIGTFMLIGGKWDHVNKGDLLILACSFIAAFHIIYIGKNSDKIGNAFRFNNFQSFWCLMVLLPFLPFQDHITLLTNRWLPWLGILSLGLASSLVAFYLQIRAQKVLTDSTASMLFLLESPFAAFFGYLLLKEQLGLWQTLGAVLILAASALQILFSPAKSS